MSFEIKPATRQAVKPLIALYSESGCGKTYSSLLLARGLVGPTGKIVLADSESGRGSLYADVLPGGYDTLGISEPFTPGRYIEAMEAVERSGAGIGIIDSGSHEWEGLGGVLDMAAENEEKNGRAGLNNWKKPKMAHARWVLKLLQSPLPWIICLRAKYKSRQIKGTPDMADSGSIRRDQIGKTVIIKDDHTSPIQAEDFIFEVTAHAEILQDHSIRLTKVNHPELRKCFPAQGPITIEHGKLIAQWCAGGGRSAPAAAKDPASDLKRELWDLCQPVHQCPIGTREKGIREVAARTLTQWLIDEAILSDTENLAELAPSRLPEVLAKAKEKLTPQPAASV